MSSESVSIVAQADDRRRTFVPPKTRSSSASPSAGWRPKMDIYIGSLYDERVFNGAIIVKDMSIRSWVTVVTLILLGMVVFFGWPEIAHAWGLLGRVNLWILATIIPVQLLSYYAVGNIIFSYLRSKGELAGTSHWVMTRMALELNFVNHILPSGGAAGFSYLGWVLNRHGVNAGRAAMAQLIRYSIMFLAFIGMLFISVMALILDHQVNRTIILLCVLLGVVAIGGTVFLINIIGSTAKLTRFSKRLAVFSNKVIFVVSFGKLRDRVASERIEEFFHELHTDYLELKKDKKVLRQPLYWAIIANTADVLLLAIAYWALGVWVNPAILFVAFGVSGVASIISVTPGGAGIYEAIMIAFLASAGVEPDVAIAGTLLARVALLSGTIIFGYVFYQLTIFKYGKKPI